MSIMLMLQMTKGGLGVIQTAFGVDCLFGLLGLTV